MTQKKSIEYRRFIISLIPPAIIVFVLWMIKIIEVADGLDLFYYGVKPREVSGLVGILTSPFIHSNFNHLINNSVPFFLLLVAIFYFYQKVAWRVLAFSYVFTGSLVWIVARSSYHIGASGLIYSFASFLFVSGIIRKNINLLAISLLVIFLYGSMVWGIFPYRPDMSFESHLMGLTVGVILAWYFRDEGPGPTPFISDMEDEQDEGDEDNSSLSFPEVDPDNETVNKKPD